MGRGRPRGSRNKKTLYLEAMQQHGEPLIHQCQMLALKGDPTALRLCIERLVPLCKPSNGHFRLPVTHSVSDLVKALAAVMHAVARGQLSAQEGEAFAKIIESQKRTMETEQFEVRLQVLEQSVAKNSRTRSPSTDSDV